MKRIIKMLKRKQFLFIIIVYPLLFYCAGRIEKLFHDAANSSLCYGAAAYLFSAIAVLFTVFEVFKRIQGYELQGDKLKMRQREGINVEDIGRKA